MPHGEVLEALKIHDLDKVSKVCIVVAVTILYRERSAVTVSLSCDG